MDIGKRIKELRIKRGYSQNRFADFACISQAHLRRVEMGLADITVGHLQLVCDALGISLQEFFSVSESTDELNALIAKFSPKQKQALVDFIKTL